MAKKPKAYYPVQRHIRVRDKTAATAGGRFLQSTRLLSEANRRLYRQSYVYNLKIDLDIGSDIASAGVDVYVLRNTWDLHGAYKFAMKTYYNSIKEELANAKGANTRWHDFRVQPDFQSDELEVVAYNPATTPAMTTTVLANGDHDFSSNVDSAGTQRFFGLDSTAGTNSWSIMNEWKTKDRIHQDPASAATQMPYGGMVEDLDEANYDILRQNGAVPPYDDEAQTSMWNKVATLKQTTPGDALKLTSGYFEAPLGLVVLVSSAFTTSVTAHGLTVVFQAGDYKGVKATRYATPMLTEAKEYEVV